MAHEPLTHGAHVPWWHAHSEHAWLLLLWPFPHGNRHWHAPSMQKPVGWSGWWVAAGLEQL